LRLAEFATPDPSAITTTAAFQNWANPYTPLPYQADFHAARWKYKYRWLSAGVGTGKTVSAEEEDLYYTQAIAPGMNGIILCPDYGTFHQVVLETMEQWWPPIWTIHTKGGLPEIHVDTPRGISKIFVRVGSNKRSVRNISGLQAAWAHVEEAGRIHEGERAIYFVKQRLRESEIEYTDRQGAKHKLTGPIHYSGTPWPGYLVDEFGCGDGHPPHALTTGYVSKTQSPEGEPDIHWWIRQARTSDNPHLPKGFVAQQYAGGTDSEWAQQELEGQIVQSRGRMIHNFHQDTHVIPHTDALELLRQCGDRAGGVDPGWAHPAALIWGGFLHGGGRAVIAGEWVRSGMNDEDLAFEMFKTQRDHGVGDFYVPPERYEGFKKRCRGFYVDGKRYEVHGVKKASNDRAAGWSAIRNLCSVVRQWGRPGLLVSDQCPHLISQLVALRRPTDIELNTGIVSGLAREGQTMAMEDDAADAARYLLHSGTKDRARYDPSWQGY